jgi:CBS domain-containing protein
MRCPSCDTENIQGAALCEDCGLDLAGLDTPEAGAGFAGRLTSDEISELEIVSPLTIDADASVREAIELLRREHHGCVLIEDGGKLTGIFTERDVLTRVVKQGLDVDAVKIREVMTADPYTLESVDPPVFAIHKMVTEGFRHMAIMDGTKLRGFISVRNVLRYIHDLSAQ